MKKYGWTKIIFIYIEMLSKILLCLVDVKDFYAKSRFEISDIQVI